MVVYVALCGPFRQSRNQFQSLPRRMPIRQPSIHSRPPLSDIERLSKCMIYLESASIARETPKRELQSERRRSSLQCSYEGAKPPGPLVDADVTLIRHLLVSVRSRILE